MMTRLGKYELIRELANGSMGAVYLGRDPLLEREVAVKTMLAGSSVDPQLRERFLREARACARLHHPSIVVVYDLGEQDGLNYIVMELLNGIDLRRFIQDRRQAPLAAKLDVLARVAEGLEHAHQNGIIHRDIKPSNIFVQSNGQPKLIDFGIAKHSASSYTLTGQVLGTPNYMAPEQILGKPVDGRSDLFSLAIVAFEFLTFQHPFQGESVPRRIVRENPDSLLVFDPDLPPELGKLLAKCFEKDPGKRPASAGELAESLRIILQKVMNLASQLGSGTMSGTRTGAMRGVASGTWKAVPEAAPPAPPVAATAVPAAAPPAAAVPSPNPAPDPAPNHAPDPGTEWRMGHLLTSLQEFDEAYDREDLAAASAAFEQVKRAAGSEERFKGAVSASTERFDDLKRRKGVASNPPAPSPLATAAPAAPEPLPEPPPPAPPTAAAPPTLVYAQPFAEARGSSGDATSLFTSVDPVSPNAPTAAIPAFAPPPPEPPRPVQPQSVQIPAVMPPPSPPIIPGGPPAPGGRKLPVPLIAGAVVCVALLIGAVTLYLTGAFGGGSSGNAGGTGGVSEPPVTGESWVATAKVTAAETVIYDSPGGKEIAKAPQGETLSVLRLPDSAAADWTSVQWIRGNQPLPPGFARTRDLGNWAASDPASEIRLIRLFAPSLEAPEADRLAYASRLLQYAQGHRSSEEGQKAGLEAADLYFVLIRQSLEAKRDKAVIEPLAASVQAALAAAESNASFKDRAETMRKDLAAILTPAASPEDALKADLANARVFFARGEYEQSRLFLRRILQAQPGHPEATALLAKVNKAIEDLGKL